MFVFSTPLIAASFFYCSPSAYIAECKCIGLHSQAQKNMVHCRASCYPNNYPVHTFLFFALCKSLRKKIITELRIFDFQKFSNFFGLF